MKFFFCADRDSTNLGESIITGRILGARSVANTAPKHCCPYEVSQHAHMPTKSSSQSDLAAVFRYRKFVKSSSKTFAEQNRYIRTKLMVKSQSR